MKKWLFFGLPMGCMGGCFGCVFGPLILIIILCVSVTSPGASGRAEPATSATTRITHDFTGKSNTAVVNAATTLVQTLYACGDGHYNCYTSSFPSRVLQYLDTACGDPDCPYAQSGNFQCVFFVLGAYYLAGESLPAGPDAVDFWSAYQDLSGWQEILPDSLPEPGDMAVFSGPSSGPNANPAGHIAIVIDLSAPTDGSTGFIQLAQANGLKAVENLPLTQTNPGHVPAMWQLTAWSGYDLLGYIRNAAHG